MTRRCSVRWAFNWYLNFLLLSAVFLLVGLQVMTKMPARRARDGYWTSFFWLFCHKSWVWSRLFRGSWMWTILERREKSASAALFHHQSDLYSPDMAKNWSLERKKRMWLTKTTMNVSGPGCFSKWHHLVVGLACHQLGESFLWGSQSWYMLHSLSGWSTNGWYIDLCSI